MYAIEMNPENKIFLITLSGLLSREEVKNFLVNLTGKLKTFNTSKYYLIVDMQNFKYGEQDSLDNVKKAEDLLITTPFKGLYSIKSKECIITNLQSIQTMKKRYPHQNYSR
jgi:hypothetical protein